MRIPRRYTTEGQDPFAAFRFVPRTSRIVNPDGSVVFEMKDVLAPGRLVAGGGGHPGPEVLPQGRRAGADLSALPSRASPPGCSAVGRRSRRRRARARRPTPARSSAGWPGCWTYWGWKGGYFSTEADARAFLRRNLLHAGGADGGAELAAVVQHRPALGLRHRRAAAGALLRRSADAAR